MAHEATPMPEGRLGHKHALGPSAYEYEPHTQVRPLSGWKKSPPMGLAMQLGPQS